MISYIRGILDSFEEDKVIVDVGGVGYGIYMSGRDIARLSPAGSEVKIYTYLNVKEDAMKLYGFLTKDALQVFRLLIGVSGIGPKGGLGILSALTPDDLRFAIAAQDVKAVCKAPGIGKKTAEKLILELKDKLSLEDALSHDNMSDSGGSTEIPAHIGDAQNEAIQALVALGYGSTESLKAVRQVEWTEGMETEDLLKQALKNMAF